MMKAFNGKYVHLRGGWLAFATWNLLCMYVHTFYFTRVTRVNRLPDHGHVHGFSKISENLAFNILI